MFFANPHRTLPTLINIAGQFTPSHINLEIVSSKVMPYTCRTTGCSGTYPSRAELLHHQKSHQKSHEVRFSCPFKLSDCDFTSCDKQAMAYHASVAHPKASVFPCPDLKCAFMSAYSVSVRRHAQTQHGHPCDIKPRKPKTATKRVTKLPVDMAQESPRSSSEEIYQDLTGDGPGYDTFLNPNATHFPDPILYPDPPAPGSSMPYMASPFYDINYSSDGMCSSWQNPAHVAPVKVERRVSQSMYYFN